MSVDAILAETTPRAMRIALMEGDRLVSLHELVVLGQHELLAA